MRLIGMILLSIIAGVVTLTILLDLFPERRVTMAAGGEGSAYHEIALRYRNLLAVDGITLDLLDTAGSVENIARLAEGEADVALLQGGIPAPEDAPVSALATIFLEPLLVFHRAGMRDANDPTRWSGQRVAAGGEGSGTRFAVETILETLDVAGDNTLLPLGGAGAAAALLAGEIDVAVFVAPVGATYLEPLYAAPEIDLASIRDVEAIRRRLPFVMAADLPPASLNYAAVKPATRIDLAAMVAQLVARDDLHPALVDRFIKAARRIHGGRDLLADEGQFPSIEASTLQMNKQAQTILTAPPSRLDRFIPWWMAAQITKMALLLVPLVLVLLPMLRVLPGLYGWTMKSRVYKYYSDLIEIEKEAKLVNDPAGLAALSVRLDEVQDALIEMRLPEAYRDRAYMMQMHIDLIRSRLGDKRAA